MEVEERNPKLFYVSTTVSTVSATARCYQGVGGGLNPPTGMPVCCYAGLDGTNPGTSCRRRRRRFVQDDPAAVPDGWFDERRVSIWFFIWCHRNQTSEKASNFIFLWIIILMHPIPSVHKTSWRRKKRNTLETPNWCSIGWPRHPQRRPIQAQAHLQPLTVHQVAGLWHPVLLVAELNILV